MNFWKKKKNYLGFLFSLQQIQSKCSKECLPGQMKKITKSQHICCYECANCPENHYSNQTGNYTHYNMYTDTPDPCLIGQFFYMKSILFIFLFEK